MKRYINTTRRVFAGLIGISLLSLAGCSPQQDAQTYTSADSFVASQIFLVRHAEKTAAKTDPALTQAGQDRAQLLANMLGDVGITHIHSSDYKRTRDTAAPLAAHLGLEVMIYDPRDLEGMAAKLKSMSGRHLVVGHSNTTPPLTELLGGEGGRPIVEATEYDRLYIVTPTANGEVTTTLLRFGAN
ncbi:MAG: histidine phosphatase family protein [Maricaulaceae bacterium]